MAYSQTRMFKRLPNPDYQLIGLTPGRYVVASTVVHRGNVINQTSLCGGSAWFDVAPGQIAFVSNFSLHGTTLVPSGGSLEDARIALSAKQKVVAPIVSAVLSPTPFIDPQARGSAKKTCRQLPANFNPLAMPRSRSLDAMLQRIERLPSDIN